MKDKATYLKQYIGDGVYVEFKNGDIILTTENGIATTNRIVLEFETYINLTYEVKAFYRNNIINNEEGSDETVSKG